MDSKQELIKTAMDYGVDYFGVSPVSRLKNLPAGHRPEDLLEGAKSVIVLGISIPNAAMQAHRRAYEGLRHSIGSYIMFGYNLINENLDQAVLQTIYKLEKCGGYGVGIPSVRPKNEEKQTQIMSNRYAAVCAGLGEMGMSGFVLTPKDGPRVRWASIITDMEIEPDQLYAGEKLCQYPQCKACIETCPTEALSLDKMIEVEIDEYKTRYSFRDKPKCRCATAGLVKGTPGRLQADLPKQMETMEDWLQLYKNDDIWNRMEIGTGNYCNKCMVVCPVAKAGGGQQI